MLLFIGTIVPHAILLVFTYTAEGVVLAREFQDFPGPKYKRQNKQRTPRTSRNIVRIYLPRSLYSDILLGVPCLGFPSSEPFYKIFYNSCYDAPKDKGQVSEDS